MRPNLLVCLWCMFAALGGCATLPGSEAFFDPVTLEQRQVQTRLYESGDDARVLQASIALLLDNGFQINQAENRLGWVHAYKVVRWKAGQGVLFAPWRGVFYATVVTGAALGQAGVTRVRVTFHGADYSKPQAAGALQLVENPEIYQEFFNRLSTALFLGEQRL
jgi:hypothetical protein